MPTTTNAARPRTRPIRVGLFLPHGERHMDGGTPRWADILAMARRAEEAGFDSLWVSDHLTRFGPIVRLGPWECWSLLAALAATTSRAELGPLVSSTSFREPALLAKMAATVDEISSGRLVLGIGAGWREPEYRAFGYPFDHRASRFEEALTIIREMLRDGASDFQGRYYQVHDAELRPAGPRPAGPPIMMGASGDRMLRLAARHADRWNCWLIFGDSRPAAAVPYLDRLDQACAAVGRDPLTIERSIAIQAIPTSVKRGLRSRLTNRAEQVVARLAKLDVVPLAGTPEELANDLLAFAELGVCEVQVQLRPNNLAGIEAFAQVLDILDRAGIKPPNLERQAGRAGQPVSGE